jgi:hypothetical protein
MRLAFPQRGLRRVFVRVDVTARVEPLTEFVVVDEQHPSDVVEDDRGGGEVPDAGRGCCLSAWLADRVRMRPAAHCNAACGIPR